ncbi:uncharacterized protein LOC129594182 [Paramacrobiotus metropolitanus]|uniref:uncharacterized protein LOC129594182 n=1 Tax=Paramacrobiotus metropolitanus TaxID=2943436 RepID=UPI00244593F5|nr:uncharacterized protein LOC129594182 [Paramacrobiotus metropolitanus]XP_055346757.1 uncharacterized protein LOC129594182 [Paramacrobiotus metropolitanus]XP_055346758.1 uncharacterized protein LOC129594182 [Paramacrobiotus metropolitanus]XP_055346759.1 uncharacterized protein LOC129594182 [Paramacrobiotus metropolitanus]
MEALLADVSRCGLNDSADCEVVQEDLEISCLLWEILSETLGYLDIHSQIKAKGVCSLWNQLITEPLQSVCVTLDLVNITAHMPVNKKTSDVVQVLLEQAISRRHVKGLLIDMHVQQSEPRDFVASHIDITSSSLLVISLKNCRNCFMREKNRTHLYFEIRFFPLAHLLRRRKHPKPGGDEWTLDQRVSYTCYSSALLRNWVSRNNSLEASGQL